MIVIDASAVLDMLLQTGRAADIADRALGATEHLHAPYLIEVEVTQVLRRLVHHKEISAARAERALADFQALPLRRHAQTSLLARMFELRDGMTAYDAAYVALAEALDAPLLTSDARLCRAHGHRATVIVF